MSIVYNSDFWPFDYIGRDSGVVALPRKNQLLKFYTSLKAKKVLEYHSMHNKLPKKIIDINNKGWIHFN